MFGQKFTNTNKMLQCKRIYCAKFGRPKSDQLNTALVISSTKNNEAAPMHMASLLTHIVHTREGENICSPPLIEKERNKVQISWCLQRETKCKLLGLYQ
jgi:hypothetical protein